MSRLPEIQRNRLQATKDVVPAGLRSMDYWQIMDYWKIFDKNGDGKMDKVEFFHLMNRMNPDPMDRKKTDKLFSAVDADASGEIDCEEFLSWIFQMYAPYSGGLRERLGDMDPTQVVDYFKRIDTNGNGELDKTEFWQFIAKFCPEARLNAKEAGDMFDVIDKDGSGEIDAEEFVRWVYPGLAPGSNGMGRRGRRSMTGSKKSLNREASTSSLEPSNEKRGSKGSNALAKAKALMTVDPRQNQQPVVLEFTIGTDFRGTMLQIQTAFSKKLADSVSTKIIIDNDARGCSRFVLRVGRGVVLWDKPTMMAFRDNPFATFDSSRDFVMETIRERMPSLLRAAAATRK